MSCTGWVVEDLPIADVKLEDIKQFRPKKVNGALDNGTPAIIPQGLRTAHLLRVAGKMRNVGCDVETIGHALRAEAAKCDPP